MKDEFGCSRQPEIIGGSVFGNVRKEFDVTKPYPRGLDGRQRDRDGEIRKKRDDTLVRTLRAEYGDNFAKAIAQMRNCEPCSKAKGRDARSVP